MRRATAHIPQGGAAGETLRLPYQDRYCRRGVLALETGEEILLDLAQATELADGDALELDDGLRVTICAVAEPLADVRGDLARLAWHIGNRHTPCEVQANRLLIQRDHVLEEMLRGLGAEVTHVDAPFQPEGGAYGYGRTHGHSHSHDPHANPNAHIPHRHD
ncbi:MAG: urease accessory protein UreE [Pseudomonadota bacterium]